jgi:phosphoglycerate dehydrogenase-like enzyme
MDKKQDLLRAYTEVESSGYRLGVLKKELIPIAEELVKEKKLKTTSHLGCYTLLHNPKDNK